MIDQPPDDPVFLHARREAIVILLLWGAAFGWTVTYCTLYGYSTLESPMSAAEVPLTLGMPSWVVWGVAFPWLVCMVVSIWLALFFIQDDDLNSSSDLASEESND
ncbi:MAG: hypothetical protein R3C01_02615 [Planctomycetaceae bacterium]